MYQKDRLRDGKLAVRNGRYWRISVPLGRFLVPNGGFSVPKGKIPSREPQSRSWKPVPGTQQCRAERAIDAIQEPRTRESWYKSLGLVIPGAECSDSVNTLASKIEAIADMAECWLDENPEYIQFVAPSR